MERQEKQSRHQLPVDGNLILPQQICYVERTLDDEFFNAAACLLKRPLTKDDREHLADICNNLLVQSKVRLDSARANEVRERFLKLKKALLMAIGVMYFPKSEWRKELEIDFTTLVERFLEENEQLVEISESAPPVSKKTAVDVDYASTSISEIDCILEYVDKALRDASPDYGVNDLRLHMEIIIQFINKIDITNGYSGHEEEVVARDIILAVLSFRVSGQPIEKYSTNAALLMGLIGSEVYRDISDGSHARCAFPLMREMWKAREDILQWVEKEKNSDKHLLQPGDRLFALKEKIKDRIKKKGL